MPPGAVEVPNVQITTFHLLTTELNRADRGCGVPFRVLVGFLLKSWNLLETSEGGFNPFQGFGGVFPVIRNP